MDTKYIVSVENLTKIYRLYSSSKDRLKESFHPFRKKYHSPFNALDSVSFKIEKGEIFGVVGVNGSGKSTLMQILSGVLEPTSGEVSVNGRVSPLLELGAGFNPEFSGKDNVYLNAGILGMTPNEIRTKYDSIVSFADIGEFIDQPVKTYSSGMYVRLAFAVAISVEPEILIVDEALSVGDIYFQHKCMHRMKQLMNQGVTIIFVSHDLGAVRSLCSRAMFLENGKIVQIGDADEVVNQYTYHMIKNEEPVPENGLEATSADGGAPVVELKNGPVFKRNAEFLKRTSETRAGSREAKIQDVEILDEEGVETSHCFLNQKIVLRVCVEFFSECTTPNIGFTIRDKNGAEVIGTNCVVEKIDLQNRQSGDCIVLDFCFENVLKQGSYSIAVAAGISDEYGRYNIKTLDWVDNAVVFKSEPDLDCHVHSLVKIPVEVTVYD